VSALEVGDLRVMDNVAIGRDERGVYAMSAVCPHAGCLTEVRGEGLFCPCHGSAFDANGTWLRGPARRSLPHLQVDIDGQGRMTIEADIPVSGDVRTAVAVEPKG
jgi:Rieske Fe-S protein